MDFDFDVKDEMSSMKKKIKTEEEINKCQTSEDFTQVQKANYILKKGYEVQKKSIVSNLYKYMQDLEANTQLVPLILNSIEVWDTEFQCLLAQSLSIAAPQNLLFANNIKKAIELSLEFINNMDNDDVYYSWREAFPHLIFRLNFVDQDSEFSQVNIMENIIFPKINEMIDRKQEKRRRMRGTELIVNLLQTQSQATLSHPTFLKLFETLCQDNNFIFRVEMAEALGQIKDDSELEDIALTKEDFAEGYYLTLMELVSDSDNMVKIKAL